jgi:hypothetical protein
MNQFGPHRTDFQEVWYLSNFPKSIGIIQVSLESDKNNGYFTWRPIYIFYHISLISSYNQKCFRQTLQRKSKHTSHVQFFFFRKSWNNVEKYGRTVQATDDNVRMRIACWIPKTSNAHVSICNNYSFSTESIDARPNLSVTRYVHFLSCWLLATNVSKNKDQS